MKLLSFILTLLIAKAAYCQADLFAEERAHDFGTIEQNVYQINTGFIISNTGDKTLYILRADAKLNVKVKVSKRQIESGDTAYIQLFYFPEANGSFNEKVDLISNAKGGNFELKIKGKIKNFTPDDKQACFSFQAPLKKRKTTSVPIVITKPTKQEEAEEKLLTAAIIKREKEEKEEKELNQSNKPLAEVIKTKSLKSDSNVLPEKVAAKKTVDTIITKIEQPKKNTEVKTTVKTELDNHKSNNLIFLIDISSSMRDSTKLPYLKIALNELLDNIRIQDKITLITYSDSIKVLGEAINQNLAADLKEKLKPIKAKGLTKGKEAIIFAAKNAVKHYIVDGNNEIILASDGEFKFFEDNYTQLKNITKDKNIKISTIFFGDELKAQMNLRKISYKGNGFFIKINNRKEAKIELLEKVKAHSKLF
jgi:Mg-chelatase subunit ChlD